MSGKNIPYIQQIGMLDTKQFHKLQVLLEPLNEVERMEIMFNQLKLEIERDDEADDIEVASRLHL